MRWATRAMFAGSLIVVTVAGAAGVASAKTVTPQKYAKTLCGAYDDYNAAKQAYDTAAAAAPTDAAGYLAAIEAAAGDLTDAVDQVETKLKKVSPDVGDGKKISKLFVKNMNEISSEVTSALDALKGADPAAPTFSTAQADYETALTMLDTKTTDPFSKLDDQDVIAALGDEKACADVVTVVSD